MAVNRCIATARQYLFKRNFNENKWASVGTGVCKVKVTEKGGEFYFIIENGEGASKVRWVCFVYRTSHIIMLLLHASVSACMQGPDIQEVLFIK